MDAVQEFKRLGVRVAIDAFGTTYSSLVCLKYFPIGVRKVDRASVCNMAANATDAAFVASCDAPSP